MLCGNVLDLIGLRLDRVEVSQPTASDQAIDTVTLEGIEGARYGRGQLCVRVRAGDALSLGTIQRAHEAYVLVGGVSEVGPCIGLAEHVVDVSTLKGCKGIVDLSVTLFLDREARAVERSLRHRSTLKAKTL